MFIDKLKELRNNHGWSREKVSELTYQLEKGGIEVSRLERIERSKLRIHPDEVVTLSKVYNEPTLCNYYCAHECEIGKVYVPPVEAQGLEKSILEIIAALNRVQKQQERLIEITADGTIDESEKEDFKGIREELERISVAVEALQFWTEKNLR